MSERNIICPKCGAKNPQVITEMTTHYTETCMNILSYKRNFWGKIKPVYCKSINVFDECNEWITKEGVLMDKNSEKLLRELLERLELLEGLNR